MLDGRHFSRHVEQSRVRAIHSVLCKPRGRIENIPDTADGEPTTKKWQRQRAAADVARYSEEEHATSRNLLLNSQVVTRGKREIRLWNVAIAGEPTKSDKGRPSPPARYEILIPLARKGITSVPTILKTSATLDTATKKATLKATVTTTTTKTPD